MLPRYETLVEEIKTKRKELGWSQRTLAKRAGVSKSLVGKLERMDNVPNYRNVRKIYGALKERVSNSAEEYVTAEIVSIKASDEIKKAADLMKEKDFSQLPVKEEQRYIGLITSTDIAAKTDRKKSVRTVKLHSLPRIPHDTPKEDFTEMFNTHRAVLVEKNGESLGMITPADLL